MHHGIGHMVTRGLTWGRCDHLPPPPQTRHLPPIRSMRGQRASYWNAFLFILCPQLHPKCSILGVHTWFILVAFFSDIAMTTLRARTRNGVARSCAKAPRDVENAARAAEKNATYCTTVDTHSGHASFWSVGSSMVGRVRSLPAALPQIPSPGTHEKWPGSRWINNHGP